MSDEAGDGKSTGMEAERERISPPSKDQDQSSGRAIARFDGWRPA